MTNVSTIPISYKLYNYSHNPLTVTFRRDTAEAWLEVNPTLRDRELAVETDTGRFKLGNGHMSWVNLPYWDDDVRNEYGERNSTT